MDIVEKLNKLSKKKNTELDNQIEKLEQEYKKIFGNNDYTNIFDDDETYLKKLKECIEFGISYDELYNDDNDENDLI
jgi:hypothetical protein